MVGKIDIKSDVKNFQLSSTNFVGVRYKFKFKNACSKIKIGAFTRTINVAQTTYCQIIVFRITFLYKRPNFFIAD
jgi:hypothetical protein